MHGWIHFQFLIVASSLIDGVTLMVALLGRPRRTPDGGPRRIGLDRLAAAVVLTGVVFAIKLLLFTITGVRVFGWMRLVYVALVVTIPAAALILLLIRWRDGGRRWRLSRPVLILAVIALCGAPIGAYATYIEPYRLQLETATVTVGDRATLERPVRIAVLADIQTDRVTDYERRAVDRIMAERPDVVLLPGDLFHGSRDEFESSFDGFRDLLMRLDAPGGAFFVQGDADRDMPLDSLFDGTPVRFLRNEIIETSVGATRLLIAGVELRYDSSESRRTFRELIETPRRGRLKVLFAHRPDVVTLLPAHADIDLVVAGHTHGGQVVIPFYGPPVTFSSLPRHIGAGGLHDWNGNALYVSRGVGLERGQAPRVRFLCPPEVTLLTIRE